MSLLITKCLIKKLLIFLSGEMATITFLIIIITIYYHHHHHHHGDGDGKKKGEKKVPSSSLGQVDFLAGQVTFKAYLVKEQQRVRAIVIHSQNH